MPGWSRRLHFIRLCFFPTTRRVYAWLQGAVHGGAVSNRRKGNSQNDPAVGVVGKGCASCRGMQAICRIQRKGRVTGNCVSQER